MGPADRARSCGQQLMHSYHTMLPESDNVVASMGWVRVLQNFPEHLQNFSFSLRAFEKSPSVGSIAGALLVDGRLDIGLAVR